MPKSLKLKLKGGGYVDPESGLEDKARDLRFYINIYNTYISIVDVFC
jgi:hypothetical protein